MRTIDGQGAPDDLRLDEQAALRRVATAVAKQRTPNEIFAIVTREIAELFGATGATLFRFEAGYGIAVADWHTHNARGLSQGLELDLHTDSATGRVYRTGAPSRIDAYAQLDPDTVAASIKDLELHATVGAPITVDGRVWGAISISTIQPQPFPPDTEARLAGFAELVAQAVANAEARRQLTASRVRIVEAADEARRRIERDLHDGAQQRLVGLALQLRLVRTAAEDPEAVRGALDTCGAELALALEELRELARGIHPTVLTERGLRPALQSVADRAPVPVELAVSLDAALTPGQEAALYFTASEAVANVAKYAQATSIEIRAFDDAQHVVIEIRDDGVGGAEPSNGSGLRGLADRVEAAGGWLDVASPAGVGTVVLATLPLQL
jgi:signal transduction histidine kinase